MTFPLPRYEAVEFSASVNVSTGDLDTLNRAKLPKRFLRGEMTLEEPIGVDVPGHGYLIRFAQGSYESDYFDPATGEVLEFDDWPGSEPLLINSTLGQYTNTIKALIAAFPFYNKIVGPLDEAEAEARIDERVAIAARLGNLIREIDPVAIYPDSPWARFISDLANGDYATEDILREEDPVPGGISVE